jgi:hypothetical protein
VATAVSRRLTAAVTELIRAALATAPITTTLPATCALCGASCVVAVTFTIVAEPPVSMTLEVLQWPCPKGRTARRIREA